MFQSAMRWLAVWLDMIVVVITGIVAMMVIFSGSVPAAYAGMAIAFAIQVAYFVYVKEFLRPTFLEIKL